MTGLSEIIGVSVSIHAPARGATKVYAVDVYVNGVSIHAPARGATEKQQADELKSVVSIHAPARGATFAKERGTS